MMYHVAVLCSRSTVRLHMFCALLVAWFVVAWFVVCMEAEIGSESDSPLSRAIAVSAAPGAACVAADAGPPGLRLPYRGLHWKRRQKKVSKRKHAARDGVLQSVSARLGREVKPQLVADRKRKGSGHDEFAAKHGSFKPELVRELSFGGSGGGDESSSIAAVKRCDLQSVACGVHVKTGRRARSLALNVLSDKVENMLKVEAEKCRIAGGGDVAAPRQWHAQKLSWDETSMRFYCPMDIVKTVCPGLSFEPRKMTVPVRKARRTEDASAAASSAADVAPAGVAPSSVAASSAADVAPAAPAEPQTRQVQANAKPAYVVQVMQAGGCIKIGDNIDAEYINRPSVCESTSAEHLYKANPCAKNKNKLIHKTNKRRWSHGCGQMS